MNNKIDLNLLTIFLEVYRLQSITLAAESLNFTQPGISGALKRLQQQLDCVLFVREGRGISPTYSATELANQIAPAFMQVNNALTSLTSFDSTQTRTFHVYICETMMLLLQPLVASDDTMGNCSIQFTSVPNDEDKMLHALSLQKADLVIDIGMTTTPSFHVEPFAQEQLLVICSNNHPRIKGSISEAQYFEERHVTLKLRRSEQTTMDYFTDAPLPDRKVSCLCDSVVSMMSMVANSDSLGVSTTNLTNLHAKDFGLQVFETPFITNALTYKIMWHNRHNNNPAHIWLRNKLKALIQKTSLQMNTH